MCYLFSPAFLGKDCGHWGHFWASMGQGCSKRNGVNRALPGQSWWQCALLLHWLPEKGLALGKCLQLHPDGLWGGVRETMLLLGAFNCSQATDAHCKIAACLWPALQSRQDGSRSPHSYGSHSTCIRRQLLVTSVLPVPMQGGREEVCSLSEPKSLAQWKGDCYCEDVSCGCGFHSAFCVRAEASYENRSST